MLSVIVSVGYIHARLASATALGDEQFLPSQRCKLRTWSRGRQSALGRRRSVQGPGLTLVLEKGYLHMFICPTQALNDYPALGSERFCQYATVMRSLLLPVVSEGNLS
ncbi:hypothetical protein ElyMa_001749300 [Elysia marginata]|uniref:Uncharacterized protein n=1 Tax=Elysia marginata TaxID=1093978 RepID=A0AAV4EAD3_9GAST|nr:hypothetical protein ElyMa_001749300 [Elysia marginata]